MEDDILISATHGEWEPESSSSSFPSSSSSRAATKGPGPLFNLTLREQYKLRFPLSSYEFKARAHVIQLFVFFKIQEVSSYSVVGENKDVVQGEGVMHDFYGARKKDKNPDVVIIMDSSYVTDVSVVNAKIVIVRVQGDTPVGLSLFCSLNYRRVDVFLPNDNDTIPDHFFVFQEKAKELASSQLVRHVYNARVRSAVHAMNRQSLLRYKGLPVKLYTPKPLKELHNELEKIAHKIMWIDIPAVEEYNPDSPIYNQSPVYRPGNQSPVYRPGNQSPVYSPGNQSPVYRPGNQSPVYCVSPTQEERDSIINFVNNEYASM